MCSDGTRRVPTTLNWTTAMRTTQASVYIESTEERDRFLPEGPRWMTVEGRPTLVWVNIQFDPTATEGEINIHFPGTDGSRDFGLPCPGRPGFLRALEGEDQALAGVEKS